MEHLQANMDALENAKIIYTTSYFMFSSNDIMMHALNFAIQKDIPVGFNLSAEYTILCALDKICVAIEYSDYVFANEHEAAAFGKSQGITDLTEVAKKIASWSKINKQRQRVAIVTQGPLPVIVATCNVETNEIKVNQYPV